jgi:IS1 family transposase
MNKLPLAKRAQILGLLVEGTSLRATSRLADVSINTVTKLLVDAGKACAEYQDKALRNLSCKRVQIDEIWSFCYAKEKNVKTAKAAPEGAGDVWTWTAIDADSKLVMSYLVADRGVAAAREFIGDLASRLTGRIQLSSDGYKAYVDVIDDAFGADIDYAVIDKQYGVLSKTENTRYSPAECIGVKRKVVTGEPDFDHISTSYVERQNLTMRMSMRRFTRLTNAFSKKVENHARAVALHFMYYNFGRIHKTLRVTPAMQAGVSDHVWTLEEIAALII